MATILIIDDDSRVRSMLRAMLEDAGHCALEAADGCTGIALLREQPAEVVLADIIMPGKCGIETIGEIHMEHPEVKIIAMSGGDPRGPESDLSIAWAYGAVRSLHKPFARGMLMAAIEDALGNRGDDVRTACRL